MATHPKRRRSEVTRGFFTQLAVFAVVNVGFVIATLVTGGEFWWFPISIIWAAGVLVYGALAYWLWRRQDWEETSGEQRARFVAPSNPLKK
jgi:membrane protein YdbS with pleckstrin-like domain